METVVDDEPVVRAAAESEDPAAHGRPTASEGPRSPVGETPAEEPAVAGAAPAGASPEAGPLPAEESPAADAAPAEDAAEAPPAAAEVSALAGDPPADGAEATTEQDKSRSSRSRARAASLYRALRSARPIEGRVEKLIKGGYEVRLGKARGFCPHSQFDLYRVDDPESHVGKQYRFRIMQVRRGGDDVVVSRRALLEDERKEEAAAVRATLLEGAVMQGRVASIAGFGAFVDLGAGVMGLVHISEVSHSRVTRVQDAVREGDRVGVKILKLDSAGKRISLSIRQAEQDPWSDVEQRFRPGQICNGVVQRLTEFGAFVQLAPGVEALAPASEFAPSPGGWREGLAAGQSCEWQILSVAAAQRRISLTRPVEGFDPAHPPTFEPGATLSGRVQRIEDYGVFVWLAPGYVGLMPNALSGTPRGEDMARRFPVGTEIEVEVRDVEEGGRRIRLARKGVEAPPERRPRREPRREPRPSPAELRAQQSRETSSFGTSLADKLRAALGDREGS